MSVSPVTQLTQFISAYSSGNKHYLVLGKNKKTDDLPNYTIVNKSPEFISEYAFHRFKEFKDLLEQNDNDESTNTGEESNQYQKVCQEAAAIIYADFKKEYADLPLYRRIFHGFMTALGLRHSKNEVEAAYQSVQQTLYGFQPEVKLGGNLKLSQEEIDQRVQQHRNPQNKDYNKSKITKGPLEQIFNQKLLENKELMEASTPQECALLKAKLKEEACEYVYDNNLPACIEAGYYDPAIIPYDIEKLLGPLPDLKKPILNSEHLNRHLKIEVDHYRKDGKLSEAQAHRLLEDAIQVAKIYKEAFPDKSNRDVFFFVRDLVRIATYQEYYDKAAFTGSDHGSKHIHNNILGSLALNNGMKQGKDYTIKDQFIEELVHFYHDIGYSVGLASTDFECCRDHPLIGAKMIEENRDYFLHYLDETSYRTLHECVLCHAIMRPNLSAGESENDVHLNMVRAVTSISDACAATYDRKTQEFWEQPRALVALSRLKSFLVLFPEYGKKMGDDIVKGPWEGYDDNNPIDVMAYDVYLNTCSELYGMVDEYNIPEDKKTLFKNAISGQFNAFTANITLGQYGGVLAGLEAIPNENKGEGEPDYIPQLSLAPSIAYGVLRDLFGKDQANAAFKKLVEEFNGDMAEIEAHLNDVANSLEKGKKTQDRKITTGVAHFKLLGRFVETPKVPHAQKLESNLRTAMGEIHAVFKGQTLTLQERAAVMKKVEEWTKSYDEITGKPPFSEFAAQTLTPIFYFPKQGDLSKPLPAVVNSLESLSGLVKKENLDRDDLLAIRNLVALILMSDAEYEFIRGKEGIRRGELRGQLEKIVKGEE